MNVSPKVSRDSILVEWEFLNKQAEALHAKGSLLTGRGTCISGLQRAKTQFCHSRCPRWTPGLAQPPKPHCREPAVFSQSLAGTPSFIWNLTSLRMWKPSFLICYPSTPSWQVGRSKKLMMKKAKGDTRALMR